MTTLEDREKAFENKFAHDEDVRFRVKARTVQLLALWAAETLGKDSAVAAQYARTLLDAFIDHHDEAALIAHIEADFQVAGIDISLHRIQRKQADYAALARQQIAEGAV